VTLEARVQELLDREQIKDLKARYFRLLDAKDWDAFRELFTDDARFTVLDGPPTEGADAFVASARAALRDVRTVHHGHTPEITLDGPAEAHGSWSLADYLEFPPDPATGARRAVKGFWRYEETYRKVDGTWRIAGFHLWAQRVDPVAPEPLPAEVPGAPDLLTFLLSAR
jgi:uncharacterized protein (TIGR02246 family)